MQRIDCANLKAFDCQFEKRHRFVQAPFLYKWNKALKFKVVFSCFGFVDILIRWEHFLVHVFAKMLLLNHCGISLHRADSGSS